MPAPTLRSKLRRAIDGRSLNSACVRTVRKGSNGEVVEQVKAFQLANILSGRTEPWNVRVRTAQLLIEAFPFDLKIQDFYKGRPNVRRR